VCHVNGACSEFAFDYRTDDKGVPSVADLQQSFIIGQAVAALSAGDEKKLKAAAARLKNAFPNDPEAAAKAEHLLRILTPPMFRPAATFPAAEKSAPLSGMTPGKTAVGYGKPLFDQIPVEAGTPFLQLGGKFYARGMYAHAPATYEYELGGAWKSLHTFFGIQDGHAGSVVFVIRGDGNELFRSQTIKDHLPHETTVNLTAVKVLTLIAEDAGDGNDSDWGIWATPTLSR
jgi:hypothetical protein